MKAIVRRIFKLIFRFLCSFSQWLFPYSTLNKWKSFRVKFYTSWISKEFKSIGGNATIYYPLDLLGGKHITIGENVIIGKRGILTAWDRYGYDSFSPAISIGNRTSIGEDCHITAIHNITIGNNVLIGKKVTISDNSHGQTNIAELNLPPIDRPLYSKGPVIIEDGVWIGDKVTIVANVRLGKNSIIGANSLVTKDVPENCVVGGVPAQILKEMI
ncbi:acyltransferase [Mucilaginibacter angelicae]|uniref:Acyltransferase n=1 Tax=Mucilaginibacter angelicae TaxID=869718 RepID=A0ABV6L5U5_9SPHI